MTIYIQKPVAVQAEVITPAVLDQLKEDEPGLVKYASIGDYLVTRAGALRSVVPAEQFGAEFETEEQHQLQHMASVLGLIDELGGRVAELEQRDQVSDRAAGAVGDAILALDKRLSEVESRDPPKQGGKGTHAK